MATGEENISEELKKLTLDLKKAAAKLHSLFDCYDLNNYPANVMRTKKENWMKNIEDLMASVAMVGLETLGYSSLPIHLQTEDTQL